LLFFVIPAYNEEKNIPYLLKSIAKRMEEINRPYRFVVVNDGSADDTKAVVESYKDRFPITLLDHKTNMNVGQVFRTAFEYIIKEAASGDIVITKEADNTGDLGILSDMLKKIDDGYDLVLASCYAKGGKVIGASMDRLLLSSAANAMLRLFFPIDGIRTYSSFYRVYRADTLKKAYGAYGNKFMEEAGFACMVEALIKLSRLRIKICEIPMVLRCHRRKGKSKMNKTRTITAYLRLIAGEFAKRRI